MAETTLQAPDWVPVAASADIGSSPVQVSLLDRDWVLVRLSPGESPAVFTAHCTHRLVPLAAGKVVDGTLQCAYHGWRFGTDGSCTAVPSLGPDANVPPRADLAQPPEVRESDGEVWLRPRADQQPEPVPQVMTNLDPALRHAWHPVALAAELGELPHEIRLLGEVWTLRNLDGQIQAAPTPSGIRERWGLIWLAPAQPLDDLFDDPDAEDRDYVGEWLPPSRTNVSAGLVADNFLDVAHFPFVHAATFGPDTTFVEPYEVQPEASGFRSVQVQPFDNPEDPGVISGERPRRQRRRATYVYRAPFQLMLRLEELDAGGVKTILFFAQPEDLGSTRIYTKMLLYGIGGQERPGPEVVAREVAFEEAVLAEDLALQRGMDAIGLPLDLRNELHVRADRLGVALRRELTSLTERAANLAG